MASTPSEDALFQLSPEDLGQLKVSVATGTPKPLTTAPAVTSVITARELQAMGAQDIGEALETVPGLHVSNGSFQYGPRYFIRGIASSYNPQTLVLVNGLPMTSLFVGDRGERLPAAYSLPVKLVKRIEIIRGPGSALYGADAFAGVINIITKGPDDIDGGQASLSYGSFATLRSSLLQSAKLGQVHGLFSISSLRTQGDNVIIKADAQTGIDATGLGAPASLAPGDAALGARNYDLRADLRWQDFRLRLNWMTAWGTGTGQGINAALDPDSHFTHHRGSIDLGWKKDLNHNWQLETRSSYLYGDFENPGSINLFPPGAFFGSFPNGMIGKPALYEENARFGLTARYFGWHDHTLTLGGGFFWGDIFKTTDINNYRLIPGSPLPQPRSGLTDVSDTPAVFQPENQRTNYYVLAQDEWRLSDSWELTAGVRHDHFSDVGDATNPRLALVWKASSDLTGKLLYGEAFRAPAFFELYGTDNPVALGNPTLKPEKLRNLGLALSWKPRDDLSWDVNLYEFHIRDFIDFLEDANQTTYTARNAGHILGRGVETQLRYQLRADLLLLANYSIQRTRNEDTDSPLGLAPRQQAYGRVTWHIGSLGQLSGQLNWIGKRLRQQQDSRADLAGYTTVDVILRRHWRSGFDAALIGRNLAAATVLEPSRAPGPNQLQPALPYDLPQAGRSITLSLSSRW